MPHLIASPCCWEGRSNLPRPPRYACTSQITSLFSRQRSFFWGPPWSWGEVGSVTHHLPFSVSLTGGSRGTGQASLDLLALARDQGPLGGLKAEEQLVLSVQHRSARTPVRTESEDGHGESWGHVGACRDQVQRVPRQGHGRAVDEGSKPRGHGLSWNTEGVIGEGLG